MVVRDSCWTGKGRFRGGFEVRFVESRLGVRELRVLWVVRFF